MEPKKSTKERNTHYRWNSIYWLLFLYTLQGVPLGMAGVFPLLLKEKGASFSELAMFSLSSWPFALKLFWAPLVDSTQGLGLGKRKFWLLLSQLGIAAVLWMLAGNYSYWLEEKMMGILTATFFLLYFLAATQDIAVDGWALTMLPPAMVGYAGTCNSVGQTAGYFLAFSGFLGLEGLGLCDLETFLKFWVFMFVAGTLAVCYFKKEEKEEGHQETAGQIYKNTLRMFRLEPVVWLCIILLTWKFPFNEGIVGLRLQERGMHKETVALFATISIPVQIVLPWLITKITIKYSSMKVLYAVYPVRVVFGLVGIALVHWAPADLNDFSQWSTNVYYVTAMAVSIAQAGFMQAMFVPQMSFFSLVSDPSMGGTYMTVLNTLSNVGSNLGGQWALRSVDLLAEWGWDGFYASTCLNVALGLLWWFVLGPKLLTLDKTGIKAWKVKRESRVMKTL